MPPPTQKNPSRPITFNTITFDGKNINDLEDLMDYDDSDLIQIKTETNDGNVKFWIDKILKNREKIRKNENENPDLTRGGGIRQKKKLSKKSKSKRSSRRSKKSKSKRSRRLNKSQRHAR
jgi:hypothetical protein